MTCLLHNNSVLEIQKDPHPPHSEWNLLAVVKKRILKGRYEIPIREREKK
jgi:hypothetical protein